MFSQGQLDSLERSRTGWTGISGASGASGVSSLVSLLRLSVVGVVGGVSLFNQMAWKSTLQVTALASAGLVGWFTSNLTERWKLTQNTCTCVCVNQNNEDDLLHGIRRMPGLPIFGTVSAASQENKPTITEKELVPLESSPVPSKSIRVSEVQYI
jgi:hypothetical protein